MNLYYIIIAIIIILLIFPSLRSSVFNYIIPMNNTNPSKKVEKFNGKNKKIVFTAFTADWCPHCIVYKKNVHTYLVKAFENHPTISIKNVDCTDDRNGQIKTPAGNSINGFPTLVTNVYVDGKMTELNFDGNRNNVDEIINYLKEL
jgi:thiol-disulfide isomerase/thioredoxin